jgi:hypothetical protein
MTTIRLYTVILIATAAFAGAAGAQTRKPARRPAPKPAPTPSTFKSNLEVSLAKEKVSNQVANVTQFTAVLAPIATSIEDLDKQSKTTRLPKATADKNAANKEKVRQAIKNLRAGLTTLETDFRTKASLKRFLPKLDGIATLGAQSEDLALAGRFTESRTPLLAVLQKLSDSLAMMP